MYGIGSIINVKNIVFKTTNGINKTSLDHSYKSGRPCLVIHEDLDKIYLLSLISYTGRNYSHEVPLIGDDLKKACCVNIRNINYRNIAFYKEITRISDKELYDILIKFINYQENINKDNVYDEISTGIKEKIEELRKYLENVNNKGKSKK